MNKELAEIIIFNSIFEAIKGSGFYALQDTLEIIEPHNTEIDKFISLSSENDYTYLKKAFNTTPNNFTLKYAEITGNFNAAAQEKWFRQYIEKPNKFVLYTISSFMNKLSMNDKLRRKIDSELLDLFKSVAENNLSEFNVTLDDKEYLFSCEEFQDLIFITFAETVYNPEIEDEINARFSKSNSLFWNRFNELYKNVFVAKFGENELINQGFFLDDVLMKYKKEYGFDVFEDALDATKYPIYPNNFLPYFNMRDKAYLNKTNDEEYRQFRRKEFALYNDLCSKYGISPLREKEL